MVHSCISWNNVLVKFYSVEECHHQNAFEQNEKDNLKKQVKEGCRKDFFVKRTPNDNNNNKNNHHENNNSDNKNCSDDAPSTVNNAGDIHTGAESVVIVVDVDFIVTVEDIEQLSCHDIASFDDALN